MPIPAKFIEELNNKPDIAKAEVLEFLKEHPNQYFEANEITKYMGCEWHLFKKKYTPGGSSYHDIFWAMHHIDSADDPHIRTHTKNAYCPLVFVCWKE